MLALAVIPTVNSPRVTLTGNVIQSRQWFDGPLTDTDQSYKTFNG